MLKEGLGPTLEESWSLQQSPQGPPTALKTAPELARLIPRKKMSRKLNRFKMIFPSQNPCTQPGVYSRTIGPKKARPRLDTREMTVKA
jgi:hypothetical protein